MLNSSVFVPGAATVVLGSQWGDEGKGKLVDILCQEADVCARCQGGNNAGHTIVAEGVKYDFHMIPSGLVSPSCVNVLGAGVVIHLPAFFQELENLVKKGLDSKDRIFISNRSHLVFDLHQIVDGLKEVELGRGSIGTTKKGIGPAYSAKASRSGLRVHHLSNFPDFEAKLRTVVENKAKRFGKFEYDIEKEIALYKQLAERIKPYVIDAVKYMHDSLKANKRVLIEGANALMLDLDFGTYPYVTSSNTAIGGVCTGLGVPPHKIGKVIGVVKAYTTRVGGGPFPTEQLNSIGEQLQKVGAEVGVTTGRKRRCGWLDAVVLKYSHMINGYTSMNVTKLDVLDGLDEIKIGVAYKHNGKELDSFPADLDVLSQVEVIYETLPGWKSDISKCRTWEDLPEKAKTYVRRMEELMEVKVEWIGVGPGRDAMIHIPV